MEVKIEEHYLKQITNKEYNFTQYLQAISNQNDPIEEIIEKDFFVKANVSNEIYSLDLNNLLPTSKIICLIK